MIAVWDGEIDKAQLDCVDVDWSLVDGFGADGLLLTRKDGSLYEWMSIGAMKMVLQLR